MKKILTKKQQVIIVNNDLLPKLKLHKWYVNANGYAERQVQKAYKRKAVYMHHEILGYPPSGKIVDHINGNKLDNRRENLRFITRQQNQFNRKKDRGISLHLGKWDAYIMVNRKKIHLGRFTNRREALQVRQEAEQKYFNYN